MSSTVGFITGEDWLEWPEGEALLRDELARRNIQSEREVWDRGIDGWEKYDALLIRSCWDYHKRPGEFKQFLKQLKQLETTIWNKPEVLQWNMDKIYLNELNEAGFPIIPFRFYERGELPDFEAVMEEEQWEAVIVKPRIGASGHEMFMIDSSNIDSIRSEIETVAREKGLFLQPYVKTIKEEGEWSFIFFDGQYQFAIHKQPGPDDFRAHNHRGGTYRHAEPRPEWIDHVQSLVDRFPKDCLYQRMDGVIRDDQLVLMEVEALEPSFYFSYYPDGAKALADVIKTKLSVQEPI